MLARLKVVILSLDQTLLLARVFEENLYIYILSLEVPSLVVVQPLQTLLMVSTANNDVCTVYQTL